MSETWQALVVAVVAAAIAIALLMGVTAVTAKRIDRLAVVDVVWGLGFVVAAVVAAVAVTAIGPDSMQEGTVTARRWVVVALVGLWGARLAWHIRRRAHALLSPGERAPEDPRYAALMEGRPFSYAVTRVFVTQGVAMLVVALPVLVAVAVGPAEGWGWWVVGAGAAVWLFGLVFEAVGDAQLAAYKSVPKAERAPVMDRGLWAWTRHPNYFGDACVWWGLWLAGGLATGWTAGLATVIAPIAMTYFLAFATGARLLEREMMTRPGYPEYAARTSMFVPLPPRRGATAAEPARG